MSNRISQPEINDFDQALDSIWALLGRGVADRRHGFHHPAIATLGLDGAPRNRIVVLRGAERARSSIRFHTDQRSTKCAELARDPRASALFYDEGDRVQLRVEGRAVLHSTDAIADAAWQSSQRMSRVCYGTMPAPGSFLESPSGFALPSEDEQIAAGRSNFVAVVIAIERIEWLFLHSGGHRRAMFDVTQGTARWLVP
jgi:pyridoxamine 5'-phosphate oxidase